MFKFRTPSITSGQKDKIIQVLDFRVNWTSFPGNQVSRPSDPIVTWINFNGLHQSKHWLRYTSEGVPICYQLSWVSSELKPSIWTKQRPRFLDGAEFAVLVHIRVQLRILKCAVCVNSPWVIGAFQFWNSNSNQWLKSTISATSLNRLKTGIEDINLWPQDFLKKVFFFSILRLLCISISVWHK